MPETQHKQVTVKATSLTSVAVFATLILLVLKLAGALTLSYWWVFSPLIALFGFSVLLSIIIVGIALVVLLKEHK